MATSGTIEGSFSGSGKAGQKPYIFWEQTSCSVADNTSTIKVTFKVKRVGTDYSTTKSKAPWTISIGSNNSSGTKDYKISSVGSGSYVTIGTYTKTVSHNADGTLSIALKATLNLSGTTAGTGTVSGSITLPTIARTSSASPSASSVTTGSSVQINISRKGSSFTHNVSYTLEGLSTTYTTGLSASSGIATACTFTPPHSLFKSLTTKTSVKATVTVTTMNGSTAVGSVNFLLTINLHDSAKPVISAATLTRVAGASTTANFGIYIQGLDCINVVTAAAMNASYDSGGTVTVTVTIEGKTYTGTNITSSVLNVAGTIAITVTAKDSRGRSVSVPKEISVAAYAAPRITKFLAFRAASSTATTEDAKGTYARMTGAWEYATLNGKNAVTATFSIQQKGGTAKNVVSGAAINTYYTASAVSIASTWTITLKLQDTVGNTVTDEIELLSGAKSMSFKNDGTGIAVGKYAELAGFEVDWNSQFNKAVSIKGVDMSLDQATIDMWKKLTGGVVNLKGLLLNISHPIGSIIQTTKSESEFNPNTMLGGTWKLLQGVFLFGADASHSLGATGGSPDAVVVSHNHTQNAHMHKPSSQTWFSVYTGTRSSETVGAIAGTGWVMTQLATGGTWGGANTNSVTPTNNATGVSGVGQNMPPYKVVNIWERTA